MPEAKLDLRVKSPVDSVPNIASVPRETVLVCIPYCTVLMSISTGEMAQRMARNVAIMRVSVLFVLIPTSIYLCIR
jgi:hypothetical protein